jgi:hypothetical protein
MRAVKISSCLQEVGGAPEEIRTPDPQIRSLGSTIEIIEVRSRKKPVGCGNVWILKVTQHRLLPKEWV